MNEALLSVRNLSISFGGLKAVDDVDFDVRQGEIIGLLGPNGAGKTTCFNMISGVYKPTRGEITFNGKRTDGLPPYKMALLGVGRTFQIVHPFAGLSVEKNVLIALGSSYYTDIRRLFAPWNRSGVREEAYRLLDVVGLLSMAHRPAGQLPLGNLRRLEIARALALNPKLLLLDESFSGLRHEEIDHLVELVRRIRVSGVSILLIEHNMRVAMGLSDRIVVLDHGNKLAEGYPADIARNPQVIEAYLGTEGGHHVA